MLSSAYDQSDTEVRAAIANLAAQVALKLVADTPTKDPVEAWGDMGFTEPTTQSVGDAVTEAMSIAEDLPVAPHDTQETLCKRILGY